MFDPFAGRHPPPPVEALPQVGLRTLYPVRCHKCRTRLQYKKWMPPWLRWCPKCRWAVQYYQDDLKEHSW